MPRLDTRLESEGAEFLVLGQLLIARIPTYKTYTNMPGWDLVAGFLEAPLFSQPVPSDANRTRHTF